MNTNNFLWLDFAIFPWILISLVLNGLIVFAWHKKLYKHINLKKYQGIQRIHVNEVPRLGGLIFVVSLSGYLLSSSGIDSIILLRQILYCSIPVLLIALKEDFFHNVDPTIRLIALLLTAWLFRAFYSGPLPSLENIIFINKLILLPGGIALFYSLGIVSIANGMNLLDGVNGLCVSVALSCFFSLLFLAHKMGDTAMVVALSALIMLLIPFLLFNYPYGKIFLGDLGAYSLGIFLSLITIIFFGRHSDLSPWGGLLILIYPATEVAFSFMRRVVKGNSAFHPDVDHIHLKLFYYFKPIYKFKKIANALVTPSLSLFWLYPLIAFFLVYNKPLFICIAIALFIIGYLFFNFLIPNTKK
jgi:UDP-N-acetylmuramyl pentapeptide phosphotransferase/UDP-N-acetylglucosamine-1-phosphate transferase